MNKEQRDEYEKNQLFRKRNKKYFDGVGKKKKYNNKYDYGTSGFYDYIRTKEDHKDT